MRLHTGFHHTFHNQPNICPTNTREDMRAGTPGDQICWVAGSDAMKPYSTAWVFRNRSSRVSCASAHGTQHQVMKKSPALRPLWSAVRRGRGGAGRRGGENQWWWLEPWC